MKTVQIAFEENLLGEVDKLASSQFKNRADFVSQACRFFLRYLHEQQLDQAYKKGYERFPESDETAEASTRLLDEVLEKEKWS